MSKSEANVPVFVMNTYYSGLGIARNLRGQGVDVYGLSFDSTAPGIKSRFFKGIYSVPNGRDEPEGLCKRLLELRKNHNEKPVILPTRDFDVLFLHEYRERLSPHFRLPPNAALSVLMDKMELAEMAAKHGVPVPQTLVLRSIEELEVAIPTIQFPVVIKPRFAYQWRVKGAWEAVGARKAFLVENADQLRAEYRSLADVSPEILIQAYVSGTDTDIVVCCGYMNAQHELTAYFTGKKLRQNPPLFGTGCAVEAVEVPEIISTTERFLRACGYSGLAEAEFKHDKASGTFYLIEINPRHWDQHELGTLAGINLSWCAYQEMVGGSPKRQVPVYRTSTSYKWVAEPEALTLLLQTAYTQVKSRGLLAGLRAALNEAHFLLQGRTLFAICRLGDPVPGMLLWFRTTKELFQKITRLMLNATHVTRQVQAHNK
jgi:D-aspartate ligase